ncbi:MAG: hypothetical protein R3F37_01600 [Candidatus Competibacteraceae bacterium]
MVLDACLTENHIDQLEQLNTLERNWFAPCLQFAQDRRERTNRYPGNDRIYLITGATCAGSGVEYDPWRCTLTGWPRVRCPSCFHTVFE